ncbi:MAG TPA: DUF4142 domain-containing protein [Terriglobia bacterium]
MKSHSIGLTLGLVFFLAVIAAGCQKAGVEAAYDNTSNASAPAGSLPVWDRDFLVAAEKTEVEERSLSQAAWNQARSADVKEYARAVMDDHGQTLQQLRDLMRRKGAGEPGTASEASAEGAYRLDQFSGANFDHEYISLMAAETQEAVSRFRQAAETADDREVRSYATSVLPVLVREKQQAADLEKRLAQHPGQ